MPVPSDSLALVDTHCHLADPRYDEDREATIERAVASGVRGIVCIGAGGPVATNEFAFTIARDDPAIVVTVGIHPHDVEGVSEADYDQLRTLCASHFVVAIGETGLDYHYNYSAPDVQREHFRRAVQFAREVERPLVVHSREAFADTLAILRDEGAAAVGGVIHCFTGGPEEARPFLDLGFHIGLSGVVTFNKADDVRAAARMIPDAQLLLETDSPYLAPVPHRGKRNEPGYVRYVGETVAALRDVSLEALALKTSENAARLFRLGSLAEGL